jgi:hypothetical protein
VKCTNKSEVIANYLAFVPIKEQIRPIGPKVNCGPFVMLAKIYRRKLSFGSILAFENDLGVLGKADFT